MQLTIEISEPTIKNMLMLHGIEEGKDGNYTRVEDILNPLRYRISDEIMTIVMNKIKEHQGRKPTNQIY